MYCPQGPYPFRTVMIDRSHACAAFGDTKVLIDGQLQANVTNSPMWGLEFNVKVWSDGFTLGKRADSASKKWHSLEIYIPVVDIDKLISALVDLKKAGAPPRRADPST